MPLRLCLGLSDQTCNTLTDDPSSRCPEHKRIAEARRRPGRPTSRQRGYTTEHDTNRVVVLAASRVCAICHHDGADQAGHRVARANGGTSVLANLVPVHGTEPCRVCGRRCNQSAGAKTIK